jgi:hypothetical protein
LAIQHTTGTKEKPLCLIDNGIQLMRQCFTFSVGQHDVATMEKALVDCGAIGGMCGDDLQVLEISERFVDVSGLSGHTVSQLRIVTAQELVSTHKGDAIAVQIP